ncbi:MAG: hypothetical protein C5B58_05100 [Acidobacteria bacterium]|nr:MAG: hypothetical protein C5B58_05100 [Acidobacteriota bacterium]
MVRSPFRQNILATRYLLDPEAARMIIYRIQAVAPERVHIHARTAKIQETATLISRIIRLS